jgi:hypothetical protein
MSGAVGIAPVQKSATVQLSEDGERYRLDVLAPGLPGGPEEGRITRRIWFERHTLQVVQEERLTAAGEIDAVLQCEDFRSVVEGTPEGLPQPPAVQPGGLIVRPFKITAEDGQGRGWLVLTFQEMIPNPPLTPGDLGSVSRGIGPHASFVTQRSSPPEWVEALQ